MRFLFLDFVILLLAFHLAYISYKSRGNWGGSYQYKDDVSIIICLSNPRLLQNRVQSQGFAYIFDLDFQQIAKCFSGGKKLHWEGRKWCTLLDKKALKGFEGWWCLLLVRSLFVILLKIIKLYSLYSVLWTLIIFSIFSLKLKFLSVGFTASLGPTLLWVASLRVSVNFQILRREYLIFISSFGSFSDPHNGRWLITFNETFPLVCELSNFKNALKLDARKVLKVTKSCALLHTTIPH